MKFCSSFLPFIIIHCTYMHGNLCIEFFWNDRIIWMYDMNGKNVLKMACHREHSVYKIWETNKWIPFNAKCNVFECVVVLDNCNKNI